MRLILFERKAGGRSEPPSRPEIGLPCPQGILVPASLWDERRPRPFPESLVELFSEEAPEALDLCRRLSGPGSPGKEPGLEILPPEQVRFLTPLRRPGTFRDFYSFEEHVRRARERRGLPMMEEWYLHPTFYFSNPNSIFGPEEGIPVPAASRALDFELEIGCVIARAGRNIAPEKAGSHIAGFTLLNDWSARDFQREEMAVGLGPAKGKDFATSLGPYLLTPDEIAPLRREKGYDIPLQARRNGRVLGHGNWRSIHYSFEEMIAYASRDAWLYPGDLLGSGTVGGGCILELGPETSGGWLEPGDLVEIEGGPLGVLANRIARA